MIILCKSNQHIFHSIWICEWTLRASAWSMRVFFRFSNYFSIFIILLMEHAVLFLIFCEIFVRVLHESYGSCVFVSFLPLFLPYFCCILPFFIIQCISPQFHRIYAIFCILLFTPMYSCEFLRFHVSFFISLSFSAYYMQFNQLNFEFFFNPSIYLNSFLSTKFKRF